MRDIDIRQELLRKVRVLHKKETDTRYVEELGLCQGLARVDLAVINGRLHGYEIKSERDTLSRLPLQRDAYSDAFEFVTIVAAESHLADIDSIIPNWWGIWSARMQKGKAVLKTVRIATPNPNQAPIALAQFLWRDEALQALADRGFTVGLKSKTRKELWGCLAAVLTCEE